MSGWSTRGRSTVVLLAFVTFLGAAQGCAELRERRAAAGESASPQRAAGDAGVAPADVLPGVADGAGAARPMTAALLQSELLAFADRYLEGLGEAADWGADHASSAKARAAFRQIKVVYVTAAVTTASEPDPLRVLRDLMVMVRLQVLVWDGSGFDSWVEPEARARMQRALRRLDAQLGQLAARVLPRDAIELVYELIRAWHAAHPERRYVAFTRFADLDDSELRHRFEAHIEAGGLLAPVTEAKAELQELRRVAERAIFLANHMPLLLEWQAEAFLFNTLKQPELQGVLGDVDRFADSAEAVTAALVALPERLAQERAAATVAVSEAVAQEREALLRQLADTVAAERSALLRDVRAASGELLPLAEALARLAEGSRETLSLVAALRGEEGGDEFTLAEARGLVESATRLSSQTLALVSAVDGLLGTGSRLEALDEALARHERRLFGYLLALLVASAVVIPASVLSVSRWRRRH